MGQKRITDISAMVDRDGALPHGRGSGVARWLGEIVQAASLLPLGEFQLSRLRCRRRPQRRCCPGHISLGREESTDAIRWRCNACNDQGVITNWRHTRFDLGPELKDGRVVSLSRVRAARRGQRAALAHAKVFEISAELIDGPLPLEQRVVRKLRISGCKSLHDFHQLLCDAHERDPDESYEFMFGAPYEVDAQRYTGIGEPLADDELPAETLRTRVDELDLAPGQVFGYLYDFDAAWVHRLTVMGVREGRVGAEVVERIGAAPVGVSIVEWGDDDLDWEASDDCPLSDLYGPYLPDEPPDPEIWLEMEELERLLLVAEAHGNGVSLDRCAGESALLHAMTHQLAETALAEGNGPATEQLRHCRARGMPRHDAIHEVGRRLVVERLTAVDMTNRRRS